MLRKAVFPIERVDLNGEEVILGIRSTWLAYGALANGGQALSDGVGYASQ